jgi:hypothetical protein
VREPAELIDVEIIRVVWLDRISALLGEHKPELQLGNSKMSAQVQRPAVMLAFFYSEFYCLPHSFDTKSMKL